MTSRISSDLNDNVIKIENLHSNRNDSTSSIPNRNNSTNSISNRNDSTSSISNIRPKKTLLKINKLKMSNKKCVSCEKTYDIQKRFGTFLCNSCKTWFAQRKNKQKNLQCYKDPAKCALKSCFNNLKCQKCRFEKILVNTNLSY